MASAEPSCVATAVVASIEAVGSRIESVFASVGSDLGRTHTIFGDLNSGLTLLSQELSGSKIEGASIAFQQIAARLSDLAEKLPGEVVLLGAIGDSAGQASALLKDLIKHIRMVTVIARSSRIEAASLDGERGDFLSFTQEAADLAAAVQVSIIGCSKDQEKLADAVATALANQLEFDGRYRAQLLSVSADLLTASREIKTRQAQSDDLAASAQASTSRIGGAVGGAIVALQAGDSTRQRLEHICHGLRQAVDLQSGEAGDLGFAAPLICVLQAEQLNDAVSAFAVDIGSIARSLTSLTTDAISIAGAGQSLYGGDADEHSFPAIMKQRLEQATGLISACGHAMQTVDASIQVLDDMLANFRAAIAALDDTVVDIALIGMNAGLKAARLGVKGRAFVVIANELQMTAERITTDAKLLEPVLDQIAQAAGRLRSLRSMADSANVAELETLIVQAIQEIELGNTRLARMMQQLMRESLDFERAIVGANSRMSGLEQQCAALPELSRRLEVAGRTTVGPSPSQLRNVSGVFDGLHQRYTMDGERQIHRAFCDRSGLPQQKAPLAEASLPADFEDALFF